MADQEISQFRGAELIAEKWDISSRGHGAVRAHIGEPCTRAFGPSEEGRFKDEIASDRRTSSTDEGNAPLHVAREARKSRSPSSKADGSRRPSRVRSPMVPPPVLVASEQAVKDHGSETSCPRSITFRCVPMIPIFMLSAPIPATKHGPSQKAGMSQGRDRPRRDQ